MALIPSVFFKAVVAIGRIEKDKVAWMGTGFLYAHALPPSPPKDQEYIIFLVTNQHVLDGQTVFVLRFENDKGTSSQFVIATETGANQAWVGHPDGSTDVAVLRLNGNELSKQIGRISAFVSEKHTLPLRMKESSDLCEGDGVFLLGFPMGLVDAVQNLPIARGGTVARITDSKAGRSKTFLIDCQTFPGNSGGPVLNKPELVSIGETKSLSTCYLIGIVAGYHSYRDVAISRQTGREKIVFEENSGLSVVFPVDAIEETIQFALSKAVAEATKVDSAPKDSNEVKA